MSIQAFGPQAVRDHLPFELCISIIRDAMIALSCNQTSQLPRHILRRPAGRLGLMAGAMAVPGPFGTKVIAVIRAILRADYLSIKVRFCCLTPIMVRWSASFMPAR